MSMPRSNMQRKEYLFFHVQAKTPGLAKQK
jgi:hypothetical protein